MPWTWRSSASIARIASSMPARLVPSGARTLTSNSASSTSLGMYSIFTSLNSGIEVSMIPRQIRAAARRWTMVNRSSRS